MHTRFAENINTVCTDAFADVSYFSCAQKVYNNSVITSVAAIAALVFLCVILVCLISLRNVLIPLSILFIICKEILTSKKATG